MGFPGGSEVKNPLAMQETWVRSLDWEDPLEKGMATHSSILAWRIPWTEEAGRLQSMGSQRVGLDWRDLAHSTISEYRGKEYTILEVGLTFSLPLKKKGNYTLKNTIHYCSFHAFCFSR